MKKAETLIEKILSRPKLLAAVCGAAAVAAMPPYFCFPILFAVWAIFFKLLQRARGFKQAFAIGYWFGFGFFAVGFNWVAQALALDLPRLGWLIPLAFVGSGMFFGLFAAFPACLCSFCRGIYGRIVAFAAWWCIFEWLRSFILTGFPWNLMGTTLAFSDAGIQLASVAGAYGLSLAVILFTALPAAIFIATNRGQALLTNLICLSLLAMLIWGFGYWRLDRSEPSAPSNLGIRIVQPAIAQQLKWQEKALWQNLEQYINLSQQNLPQDTKLVIWGETANPFPLAFEAGQARRLAAAAPHNGYLITGSLDYTFDDESQDWQPINGLLAIDNTGNVAARYAKSHLVPFGEYIPLRGLLPAGLRTVTNFIADFAAGDGRKTIRVPEIPPFGALICYEVIFPAEIVDPKDRPQWLINLTNDGWYGLSSGPYQHLVAARLRAVEEGLTIARAANSGISALINPYGQIEQNLALRQRGYVDFYLPKEPAVDSLYGKFHNFIPLLISLLALLAVALNEISIGRFTKKQ